MDKPSIPGVNKAILPLPMRLYGMVHNLAQGRLYILCTFYLSELLLNVQVNQMVLYFEPLVAGAVGAASNMVHSKQQMVLLDQTKTVAECALQLVYATKEGGGNPKVSYLVADVFASVVINVNDE
jgi:hypothetical protein